MSTDPTCGTCDVGCWPADGAPGSDYQCSAGGVACYGLATHRFQRPLRSYAGALLTILWMYLLARWTKLALIAVGGQDTDFTLPIILIWTAGFFLLLYGVALLSLAWAQAISPNQEVPKLWAGYISGVLVLATTAGFLPLVGGATGLLPHSDALALMNVALVVSSLLLGVPVGVNGLRVHRRLAAARALTLNGNDAARQRMTNIVILAGVGLVATVVGAIISFATVITALSGGAFYEGCNWLLAAVQLAEVIAIAPLGMAIWTRKETSRSHRHEVNKVQVASAEDHDQRRSIDVDE